MQNVSQLNNLQKITCIILRNLFGLNLFSHQSCATGTHLLQKRKYSLNPRLLIFFMLLRSCFDLFEMFFEVKKSSFSSHFFSQTAPLSSLEEAVEPEVFHSRPGDIRHLVNISAYFVEPEVFHSQPSAIRHFNISAYSVETEVFHSQPFKQTIQNSFLMLDKGVRQICSTKLSDTKISIKS